MSATGTGPTASASVLGGPAAVWSAREGARTRGDAAYALYVVVLAVAVIGVPAARVLVTLLAREDVAPALLGSGAPGAVTGAWLAGCALLVLAGAVRGPAVLSRFFTATLASSAMPRRSALLRPWSRAAGGLLLGGAALGAFTGWALEASGAATTGDALILAAAWAGAGGLTALAWLLGQLLGDRPRRALALMLAAASAAAVLLPALGRVGPGAALAPGGATATALILLGLGVAAVVVGVPLLDRLRGTVLAQQAARWEAATAAAATGDVAAASGEFRALPTTGRRLGAVARRGARAARLPILYAHRDLVALARTPERTAAGLLAGAAGAALLVLAPAADGPLRVAAILAGALVLWLASGPLVDGLRHGIATLGAPALLGQRGPVQAVLHLIVPVVVLAAAALVGAVAVLALGPSVPEAGAAVATAVLAAPLVVAVRLRDAAKGPLPVRLTMPMPTAQGDMSVIGMLAWQADAPLLGAGAVAVVAALGLLGAVPALVGAAAAVGIVALGCVSRIRVLQEPA
ncbi:hypothetical protein [Brachybacterium huguangmaarense]